jgi:hypothetical protein
VAECTFLTLNNRRKDCCVYNGDSAIDIAVNDSLEEVARLKEAICIGDQTLSEYGECIDPVCVISGYVPVDGICVCPSDKKFVDGSCVSFVTGIYFLLFPRWWV